MTLVARFVFRGRVSPRRASYFLLLRQKKVAKEKATLLSVSLRFAAGNLRCSAPAGVRRTRFAQTAAALISPPPALLGTARREWGSHGPSLRSAPEYSPEPAALLPLPPGEGGGEGGGGRSSALLPRPPALTLTLSRREREGERRPSEATARRSPNPLWLRRGAECFADQGSQLFERSEFCETPRNASTAGCPVAQRRGRRQRGRLFFAYFLLAKQKKVSPPPGGHPGPGKQPLRQFQKGARP
jgi:hypothetical protein